MNIVMIMSDEHSYQAMGNSGHPIVQTPALDRLASEGATFTNCYTPCPLCVPARASAFTGYFVNQLGTWDNATPYDGRVKGLSELVTEHGFDEFTGVGKNHFHPKGTYPGLNDHGLGEYDTEPDLSGLFRQRDIPRPIGKSRFEKIKPRESESEDEKVLHFVLDWLERKEKKSPPWVLYVGFLQPHFPFFYQQKYWDDYDKLVSDIPQVAKPPFDELIEPLRVLQRHFSGDQIDTETIRKAHVGYYSLIGELDQHVGQILDTLERRGLAEDTFVIYTSDHGEQLGHHGLWWKCCMYEESVHIPLLMKGPGIPGGIRINDYVSLTDLSPTICDSLGIPVPQGLQGASLLPLIKGDTRSYPRDFAFSEYHAHGMPTGMFMIRWQQWKYVHYVGTEGQLFNIENDPQEMNNLFPAAGDNPQIQVAIAECQKRLYQICDPDEVSRRAFQFQTRMLQATGLKNVVDFDERISAFFPEYQASVLKREMK